MFLNHILLGFLGIAFGGAVAAGTFAFGIYPHKNLKNPTDAYILIFSRTIPEQTDGFFRRPDRRE